MLYKLHIIFLAFWAGLVAAESVMELIGRRNPEIENHVARIHFYIDMIFEGPVLLAVLITGGMMVSQLPMTTLLAVKVAAGLTAVMANIVCLFFVVARKRALDTGANEDKIKKLTTWIFVTPLPGFPAAALALLIGFRVFGY